MSIHETLTYCFLFTSLYFSIFMLITFFEHRHQFREENNTMSRKPKKYGTVSILVPVWNEEKTVSGTIHSLLSLDYPKDKLKILIIDDGSTDNTWQVIQKFTNHPSIEVYRKENGGKYTALNFGLSKIDTEFVGCLDADSFVQKDALKNIMLYFENKEVMAVTPSVKIWKAESVIQMIQKVEYEWGILIRKILSYLGALYVTPGPFSIFRTDVFRTLGPYKHAYLTEDMEIAMRMQKHNYQIANSHQSIVYTVAPKTLRKLHKQRLRWTYGFLKNIFEYKHMFFNTKYGDLGIFVLPMITLSLLTVIYLICRFIYDSVNNIMARYVEYSTIGFSLPQFDWRFDWFFIQTDFLSILLFMIFVFSLVLVMTSRKIVRGSFRPSLDLLYFLVLYTFIAPLWIGKAFLNIIFSVKTNWR